MAELARGAGKVTGSRDLALGIPPNKCSGNIAVLDDVGALEGLSNEIGDSVRHLVNQHMTTKDGKRVPKKDWPNKAAAERSRAFAADKTLQAYQCEVCTKWHLGHPKED